MHVCGDLLSPWDVGQRVEAGHCEGYCGDYAEVALIVVHLEGGASRELWVMEARADDDQKRCERRQGLQDTGHARNAGRGLGQQRLQAQFERVTHCSETYQRKENGVQQRDQLL